MNIQNKKLYYKFFDLERASLFLGDEELNLYANQILNLIDSFSKESDDSIIDQNNIHQLIFDNRTIGYFGEYKNKGTIEFIDRYLADIPDWLRSLILPNFLDLKELRSIIKNDLINSKQQLYRYYLSDKAKSIYGADRADLYAYYVENLESADFPHKYAINNNGSESYICGKKLFGSFHNHTNYSDGRCKISELRKLAIECGREYVGISDHSKIVNGVKEDDLYKQIEEIDKLNRLSRPTILKSIECEILSDGSLDFETKILAQLDYVIVAVHRDVCMTKKEATKRILKAIEHPESNILAHPSSRIYKRNIGLYLDMYRIIDACVQNNVVVEINGDPLRLDLDPKYVQYAITKGAMFSLDSDTHTQKSFYNINNAIRIAEDNNIPIESIINLKTKTELFKTTFNK